MDGQTGFGAAKRRNGGQQVAGVGVLGVQDDFVLGTSLDDLAWRDGAFADLEKRLDAHVAAFARTLGFELGGSAGM